MDMKSSADLDCAKNGLFVLNWKAKQCHYDTVFAGITKVVNSVREMNYSRSILDSGS